ncbi:Fe-S cluster assembly protein SufD [Paenibacillus doosanensis]|uniref:FeS cluster assembly protein SufB n=1 Tax=Paenibacillus konkukensis TaxID=2020716 RepID=A0ABY4RLZ9_9BACL|nr:MULTISPECIES: Fe-S cluster assembly protein SufD [Paenibacillus]MCS7463658.1 Fe-S cluster assembly protein SufD [Paenibacillus doosanensis]UQZ83183.1 FeS cluster assembly protein SufB [Paenibacillus konkukensis]
MSTQTILPIDRQTIVELSQSRQEPEWMTSLRAEALELAGSLELPKLEKTRIDRWNLRSYGNYKPVAALTSLEQLPESAKALLQEENAENLLVQKNAGIVYHKVSEELAKQGVIFTSLEEALKQHSDLVKAHFGTVVAKDENQLTALHTAMWSGGVFLYVPKDVQVQVPVQALFLTDDADSSFSPHVLIVAEQHASVTYVDNFVSEGNLNSLVQNGVVEVVVKPGATVNFASVHNLNDSVTDLTYRRAVVENDAMINWVIGEMNYGNAMSDTTSVLKGNGSNSDAKIICVGTNDQKLNVTTRAIHFGKNSNSDMITRAVMRDESTAIINGITKIEKAATGANGQQTEKVLMLSPKARGDANPILLIDEDDVKAGHAASVGQVNPDQIHYLMSRGITREEAQRLVIYGFLAPVVSEIPMEKVQSQLQSLVERKLGQ